MPCHTRRVLRERARRGELGHVARQEAGNSPLPPSSLPPFLPPSLPFARALSRSLAPLCAIHLPKNALAVSFSSDACQERERERGREGEREGGRERERERERESPRCRTQDQATAPRISPPSTPSCPFHTLTRFAHCLQKETRPSVRVSYSGNSAIND